jgi:hypothetical protein
MNAAADQIRPVLADVVACIQAEQDYRPQAGEDFPPSITDRTDAAIAEMLKLPAGTPAQAAAKLAAVAGQYDLAASGVDRAGMGMLVGEVIAFLVAAELTKGAA